MAPGLPLSGEKDERFLSTLNAVEETLCRQLRACKAPGARKMVEDQEPLQSNPDLEEGLCRALLCRLRFRKHFYHLLACMRRPLGRGFELARKHISSCLLELDNVQKSSVFLRSVELLIRKDAIQPETTASGRQPIGFDTNLNLRTSAPAPPRAMKTLSWEMALEYFEKLLRDFDIICSFPLDPSLENLLHFIVEFQKRQPDLVARAYLQRHKGVSDPLEVVAGEISDEAILLCVDEFMVLVSTSNRAPDSLYEGGLQRDLFLPFIATVKERCIVHEIGSSVDYRKMTSGEQGFYLVGLDLSGLLKATFQKLVGEHNARPQEVEVVMGRKLKAVSREIRKVLTERAANFNIALDDVSITMLTFSREFTQAIEAKQVAAQEAERAKFIVEKAEQDKKSASIIVCTQGVSKMYLRHIQNVPTPYSKCLSDIFAMYLKYN